MEKDKLDIKLSYMEKYGFNLYQNNEPLIKRVTIENDTDEVLEKTNIIIESYPETFKKIEFTVEQIPAHKSVDIRNIVVDVNEDIIFNFTKEIKGKIKTTLISGEFNFDKSFDFEIIPRDHWQGISSIPEMTASFVIPESIGLEEVLLNTQSNYKALSSMELLDAYKSSDVNKVKQQVSALYTAISESKIILDKEISDFESSRKIRFADEILKNKIADSLELSLVFAAALEKMNLNPILIFTEDKVLVASWLINKTFNEITDYDITSLTKRLAQGMNQICVFDPSLSAVNMYKDFNEAEKSALNTLEESEKFILLLDVKRARFSYIRSIPIRREEANFAFQNKDELKVKLINPDEISSIIIEEENENKKLPKHRLWERKLLDLTLRNNLLNLRSSKNNIKLETHSLSELEDKLYQNVSIEILSSPGEWGNIINENKDLLKTSIQLKELARNEFSSDRLRTLITSEELSERGISIQKGFKLSMEETGANSLYLSLGMLKWFDDKNPEKERLAPLILIPVDMEILPLDRGMRIKSRDEEAMFNITLLEMLKQDFGIMVSGLDPLPEDENGIDIIKVLSIIRNAILKKSKWDVTEDAYLGLFSFSKFVMWNDIKNNMEIYSKNKVVKSLLEGRSEFEDEKTALDEEYIEKDIKEKSLIFPVSSDYSQSIAVRESVNNKSFILHGPPGTGKSQTITNIIANALLNDRRVLFVAQKMAALEVVQKRVSDLGIGAFCLELHSNKSRKKDIFDQLENAMRIVKLKEPTEFNKSFEEVISLREELNQINDEIYKKDSDGNSIYSLLEDYFKYGFIDKKIKINNIEASNDINHKVQLLGKLIKLGGNVSGPYKHPLNGISVTNYKNNLKEDIEESMDFDLLELSKAYVEAEIKAETSSLIDFKKMMELVKAINDINTRYGKLLAENKVLGLPETIRNISEEYVAYDRSRESLLVNFTEKILKINSEEKLIQHNEIVSKSFIGKIFARNSVSKELSLLSRKGKVDDDSVYSVLEEVKKYTDSRKKLIEELSSIKEIESILSINLKDENNIHIDQEKLKVMMEAINGYIQDFHEIKHLNGFNDIDEFNDFSRNEEFNSLLNLSKRYEEVREKIDNFIKITEFDDSALQEYEGNIFNKLIEKFNDIRENIASVKDWVIFMQAKEETDREGLSDFVSSYVNGEISEDEMIDVYKKSINSYLLDKKLINNRLLNINGKALEDKVNKIKELMDKNTENEKKILYYHIASKIPELVKNETTSKQLALLQRTIRSNKTSSIRSLFKNIPDVLKILCPCMLMSPISVAQYLDPIQNEFDLVIFDEASQLPTPEAIGSLGRSKNAIIVGDPKQLPPTTFFMTQQTTEASEEEDDLDNILEDALALSLPQYYLSWHYRSKHESLIEFSNRRFYDGKLNTFPSFDDLKSKVTLVKVEGSYDRGASKTNLSEAKAVVEEIKMRLMDEKLRKLSIGVVTFSKVQQTLIENLLKKELSENPDLERFSLNLPQEIFIKNLENVQGDERDVILFSIGYGPDENGRMTMNFGPLNQNGGWRRLNVAVSRSRYEMKVFTNIDPESFIVSDSAARGVRELREFLLFAKRNSLDIDFKTLKNESKRSSFSNQLAEDLREEGYKVNTNVGDSDFKIDLAIVDPDGSNNYILGIFCGGESYSSSKSAYDREILQKSVLKSLGWNIETVFIMDYLDNRQKEIDRIKSLVENLKTKNIKSEDEEKEGIQVKENEASIDNNINLETEDSIPYIKEMYKVATIQPKEYTLDEFMKVSNAKSIGEDLMKIIAVEGPVSTMTLAERLKKFYGISRITDKVIKQIRLILNTFSSTLIRHEENNEVYYMTKDIDLNSYKIFRYANDSERKLDSIVLKEIQNAMLFTLMEKGALNEKLLIKNSLSNLGYERVNLDLERFMKKIIDISVMDNVFKKDTDGYYKMI